MTVLIVVFFVSKLRLFRLEYLIGRDVLTFFLLIAVLFQPEIRRLLLRLGEAPMFRWLFHVEAPIASEIVSAVFTLSQRKIGALIVIEREVGLATVIEGGTPMNAAVSSELIVTIFWPGSPLHDGAVVVRGNRIAAAGCLLPLTEQPGLAKTLGTRHRAAIGITEESDALSIVVSEETRQVSVVHRGQLRMGLDREQLRKVLEESLIETVSAAPANLNT
jgi:diadenylate cyclase